jgi:hypothetical protein
MDLISGHPAAAIAGSSAALDFSGGVFRGTRLRRAVADFTVARQEFFPSRWLRISEVIRQAATPWSDTRCTTSRGELYSFGEVNWSEWTPAQPGDRKVTRKEFKEIVEKLSTAVVTPIVK